MSNQHTDGGINGSSLSSRREVRAHNITGVLPNLGTPSVERNGARPYQPGSFDFEHLVQSLRELFEQDRQVASQSDSTRCGICFLHFSLNELHYRDEGFYVCSGCSKPLGNHILPMIRKQQKL